MQYAADIAGMLEIFAIAAGLEATLEALVQRGHRLDLDSPAWKRERAQRAVVATLWPATLYS